MDEFLNYFEDNRFVEWVFRPNDELNFYWKEYLRNHPEEKKQIETASIILSRLKSRKEEPASCEPAELFTEIVLKLQKGPVKPHRVLKSFIRYAAVALIFFALGILLVNQSGRIEFRALNQPIEGILQDNETHLILSDGKKIPLHEKESIVEYEKNGKIVLNKHDTIESQKLTTKTVMNQLIVPYGNNSSVQLPDGTIAYLNAGSQLMFPPEFHGKTREVFLLGEGYFEVTQNKNVPFIVKTNHLNVVALGTRFNISVYPADKFIETVLVEGKVILRDNSLSIFKKEVELKPGEMASFNRVTLETITRKVEVANYVTWHEGYLNFQATELNRIILSMERYYNIKICLSDTILGMRRISGKLALREEKGKVLEVLATTSQTNLYKLSESVYGLK